MKLTRKHYNRKVLSFGLILFIAVALLSTGFAAWIMSTGTDVTPGGNVSIGVVKDGSLEFTEVAFVGGIDDIVFDALPTDTTGDIKWDDSEGDPENLTIKVTGKISPSSYLDNLTVNLLIPDEVKNAATQGYIVLPDCVENVVLLVEDGINKQIANVLDISTDSNVTTFTYTITFKWGSQFGGQNPGVYLDSSAFEDQYDADSDGDLDTDERKACYDAKVNKMVDFKKTIYGLTQAADDSNPNEGEYTKEQILKYTPSVDKLFKFTVELKATAK